MIWPCYGKKSSAFATMKGMFSFFVVFVATLALCLIGVVCHKKPRIVVLIGRMVIIHRYPKYIQVAGAELFGQIVGNCEMDSDVVDALMRSLRGDNDVLYASFGSHRWRYFFESDFMVNPLNSVNDVLVHFEK